MKLNLPILTLLIVQGCSSIGVASNQTSSSGDYNPLTVPSVDPEKYKSDKQLCFKQVENQNSKDMSVNYNILKFRQCLIEKGYVLLSWSVCFPEPIRTTHSPPTEPLEIQTDWHHSPMKSPTLRSQGSWVRSPPAAPLWHVPHYTALQRICWWVGLGRPMPTNNKSVSVQCLHKLQNQYTCARLEKYT